ncbi:MAG TPA: nucleotidyltransferase family protein, partial [Gammaproteobacteria bacterium]|nr:nucleotidyltransferase family protein [Gammaproteobacteria bacterium]
PLLKVGGSYLIQHAIQSLSKAGIQDIVINVHYLKDQILSALGDGSRYGVKLTYSIEEERLETGGGIVKALPLLGKAPFVVVSGDIVTDYPIAQLWKKPLRLAHLVMVENPAFKPQGDYCLNANQEIEAGPGKTYTFANIGLYRPELFQGCQPVYSRLADLWQNALSQKQITGECYQGLWHNVGTPQDLEQMSLSTCLD